MAYSTYSTVISGTKAFMTLLSYARARARKD